MIFVMDWNRVFTLFFENWLKFHFKLMKMKKSNSHMYYKMLFGNLCHVPITENLQDIFLQTQQTGTCSVSCYHFYFTFQFGEVKYKVIKSVISTVILYSFFSLTKCSFLGDSMMKKNLLSVNKDNILVNSESNIGSSSKFEIFRWNINFFDWAIRQVFHWNAENFKENRQVQNEFRQVLLEIHGNFEKEAEKCNEKYHFGPVKVFEKNSFKSKLKFKYSKAGPTIRSNFYPVDPKILVSCEPPITQSSIIAFKKSLEKFIKNEKRFNGCFGGQIVISVGFFQALNSKIITMINLKKEWRKEEYAIFFKSIIQYYDFVVGYFKWENESEYLVEKFILMQGIIFIYRFIPIKYYQNRCKDYSDKKNIAAFYEKAMPTFNLISEIDIIKVRRFESFEKTNSDTSEISCNFSLFAEKFLENKQTSESGFYSYVKSDLATLEKEFKEDASDTVKNEWAYLEVVNLKKSECGRIFLGKLKMNEAILDKNHFIFVEKLSIFPTNRSRSELYSSDSRKTLELSFSLKWTLYTTSRKGGIPELEISNQSSSKTYEYSFRFISENEATIKNLSCRNKIGISNVISRNIPHTAWRGFICLIEEDDNFILSPKGIYFLYVLLLSLDSKGSPVIENTDLNLQLRIFFQFKQSKLFLDFSKNPENSIEILATYQIILQRLGVYQVEYIRGRIKKISKYTIYYKSMLGFLKLREKIQKGDSFMALREEYFDAISGIDLLKKCFHEAEIFDVFSSYFEKFNEASDIVVDEKVTGYKAVNFFSGRKWDGGMKTQIPCPSQSYNNEFLENLRTSRSLNFQITYMKNHNSYFHVFDCSNIDFIVHENCVFLMKNNFLSTEVVSVAESHVKKSNIFKLPFDNRIFGCIEKLFFASKKSSIVPFYTKYILLDKKGYEYGVIDDKNSTYKFTLSNPKNFIDKTCVIKKFNLSVKKFHFEKNKTIHESFSQYSLVFRFCLDSILSFLESDDEFGVNYIIFSQYSGKYKDFFIIQKKEDFFANFQGKEYEIISSVDKYKKQVIEKYTLLLKKTGGTENNVPEEKLSNFEENFKYFDCYDRHLPVLYLKEKSYFFRAFAIVAFPRDKDEFNFCFLNCNDILDFEDASLLGRFVLVYWNVHLKWFEEALKIALTINVTVSVLEKEEMEILQLIENNSYRDVEAKLFAAWASYVQEQNDRCFNKEIRAFSKLYEFFQIFELAPSIYTQFSTLFIPNYKEMENSCIQQSMIKQLDIRKEGFIFCSNRAFKKIQRNEWEVIVSEISIPLRYNRELQRFAGYRDSFLKIDSRIDSIEFLYWVRNLTTVNKVKEAQKEVKKTLRINYKFLSM